MRYKPAAIAFNAPDTVFKICPSLRRSLPTEYSDPAAVGGYRVYLRKPN
jgi:hypothetical protein